MSHTPLKQIILICTTLNRQETMNKLVMVDEL